MSNYQVERIFSEQEIANLLSLFYSLPENLAHQDYNLFDVDKRPIPFSQWSDEIVKLNTHQKEFTPFSHYFIKYPENSFTRLHTDNNKVVKRTVVTLLETKNLMGGETLVFNTYDKRSRPANKYAKRGNKPAPVGKDIIPVVVNMNDGDSIIYDANVSHGVSQVMQGYRIVLISWFK